MSHDLLTIPCETQAREFDAKLLLSCFAAERGFSVVVGSKKEINARIGSLPRSIFVSKSLTKRNLLMYGLLEKLGHSVVCGDEEALVYASPESYLHSKVAAATLRKAKALLAWGPENARIWRQYPEFHGAPIYVTGNARVDLLRPEIRPIFGNAVEALRSRFGRFVLVNTNFSRLNHYFPGHSRQQRKLDAAGAGAVDGVDQDVGLAAHKAQLFRHFLEMVPVLARACPDHTIVVRPHPSERQQTWRDATAGCPNVRVVYEGSAVPWLIACEVVIHNGCTTAVESYLLDEPAIAYQPTTSESFDLRLPNLLSHRAFDQERLLELTSAQLRGGIPRDPTEEEKKEGLIDEYVASRRGPFAGERIVDALENFATSEAPDGPLPFAPYALARTAAALRSGIRRCEAHIPGNHNNAKYLRHMFPGATLADVEARVASFGSLLGRFSGVKARQLFANVFEIAV